jgi:hypothetical protein
MEEELEALIKVERIGADKGRVIPGSRVRLVPKIREVEQAGAPPRGVEELAVEGRVAIHQEAVHEHERLERDHIVASAGEPPGAPCHCSSNVGAGSGRKVEDLADVALLGRLVVVAGGLDDEHVQLGRDVAGDLGEADAGLVLHRAQRLPDRARRHPHSPPPLPLTPPPSRYRPTTTNRSSSFDLDLSHKNEPYDEFYRN